MTIHRIRRVSTAVLFALSAAALAACGGGQDQRAGSETNAKVLDSTGQGSSLQSFDVRKDGRRLLVRVASGASGSRVIIVTARSFRGVDRADARVAYDAAFEAGSKIDCGGGQPLNIFPDSASFAEEGRRSAYTNGEAAWVFRGQCG